jgi:hypothetical protein
MLTPNMTFPAFFRTNAGDEAIVVGHHNGAYVGLAVDDDRTYPRAWTADGEYRLGNGEGAGPNDCDSLAPPKSPAQIIWESLTHDVREIARSICIANSSQRITQVRLIRTLLSCGLVDAIEIQRIAA